jgi:4-hydroxy-4-methyl-2-oxoglutarate aldolase
MPARRDPAVSEPLCAELVELGAATLGECGAEPLPERIRLLEGVEAFAGPAATARCDPGDNLAIHVAVASLRPGEVLVVDAHEEPARGYFGEVLAVAALARGAAGLVIDGGVRDVAALVRRGLPVACSLVALRGTTKRGRGEVGCVVEIGQASVAPGDLVVADRDGAVVVEQARLGDVLDAARARAAKERRLFDVLSSGTSTLDALGLDPSLVDVAPGSRPRVGRSTPHRRQGGI